jgi:hypothetical protein
MDHVSMDSDGFTMNKLAGGSATLFLWLAIKGIQADIRTITCTSGTGNIVTSGLPFAPKCLLTLSTFGATANQTASTANLRWGFGVGVDSTHRCATWVGCADTVTPTSNRQRFDNTKLISHYNEASAFGVLGELDLVSLDANGYTINQTTGDSGVPLVHVLALGSSAGAAAHNYFRSLRG